MVSLCDSPKKAAALVAEIPEKFRIDKTLNMIDRLLGKDSKLAFAFVDEISCEVKDTAWNHLMKKNQ